MEPSKAFAHERNAFTTRSHGTPEGDLCNHALSEQTGTVQGCMRMADPTLAVVIVFSQAGTKCFGHRKCVAGDRSNVSQNPLFDHRHKKLNAQNVGKTRVK